MLLKNLCSDNGITFFDYSSRGELGQIGTDSPTRRDLPKKEKFFKIIKGKRGFCLLMWYYNINK
jgi:hypothetical protein